MAEFYNQHDTPYFLFDIREMHNNISRYKNRKFNLNYSAKSLLFKQLSSKIESLLDGFTVSSIRDLKIVRNETNKPIHFISPLIRNTEIQEINSIGNSIAFNSINQFHRFKNSLSSHIQTFMRINPEKSFIQDVRYNPCKPDSQLGMPILLLKKYLKNNDLKINGIHFHNNCLSNSPEQITSTTEYIESCLGDCLHKLQYMNIGGGYIYNKKLIDTLNFLTDEWKTKYNIKLTIEPGFDISNSAGFLVTSIIDIFNTRNKNIAILDTTVNHLPEVFEYQIKPEITQNGIGHKYTLCGCSCLAGDVFGEYEFNAALKVGQVIMFKNVGSYSYVKAHEFNGIEKPSMVIKNANYN